MKYVRVYESDCYPEEYITTYLNHCEHVANLQDAGFDFEGCIVKQADTIEELCDEFVWKKEKNELYDEHCFVANYDEISFDEPCLFLKGIGSDKPFMLKDCLKKGGVYAAIWTDKGLIYIAKMNEKGELELL